MLARYSQRSLGGCAAAAPLPPPGLCARLETATSASRAVSPIPPNMSLRAPLMSEP